MMGQLRMIVEMPRVQLKMIVIDLKYRAIEQVIASVKILFDTGA
jgi:hypothetical protein